MEQVKTIQSVDQCASCKRVVNEAVPSPHPWMYGSACSECLSAAKDTISKWATLGVFQCEKCLKRQRLTVIRNRMQCLSCCHGQTECPGIVRHDWKEKVLTMQLSVGATIKHKTPLRVLSLFEGIGTGRLVLDNLGLDVEEYFSSEIDEAAIAILNFRFHGQMQHLGNMSNLSVQKLKSLGRIDLLLGGSPCNELSLANPKRKGPYDPSASGVLLFDFDRILKFLQAASIQNGNHLFWLYENVAAIPHSFKETISKTLQCQPAKWNAIEFLPAERSRLFWGNIPKLQDERCIDKPLLCLDDILEPYRKATAVTLKTMTTSYHSQLIGKEGNLPVTEDGIEDSLLITERERLFGFPTHFTDGPNLSIRQREILIGRAWSVRDIECILKPLTKIYKMKHKENVSL